VTATRYRAFVVDMPRVLRGSSILHRADQADIRWQETVSRLIAVGLTFSFLLLLNISQRTDRDCRKQFSTKWSSPVGEETAEQLTSLMDTVRTYLRTPNRLEDTVPLRVAYLVSVSL
jgi:hypothetical protein